MYQPLYTAQSNAADVLSSASQKLRSEPVTCVSFRARSSSLLYVTV